MTPVQWPVPNGGILTGGSQLGFNEVRGENMAGDPGNQLWSTLDINGDRNMDLVIFSERNSDGDYTTFDPGPSTHWKIHLGDGAGFSAVPTAWALPAGGYLDDGTLLGYNFPYTNTGGSDSGSFAWALNDIDGDGAPDLVVTGVRNAVHIASFSPNNNDYWKVHLNTGAGFDPVPITWSVPDGGRLVNGEVRGFHYTYNMLPYYDDTGSDVWNIRDLTGDGLPDLLVTGEMSSPPDEYPMGFSPNANSYWKLFRNTGSGFNTTYETWPVPDGGNINNGTPGGFYSLYSADVNGPVGSEQWNVLDMNADGFDDLIVTAREIAGGSYSAYMTGSTRHWKVFSGSASGFAATPLQWDLPEGGIVDGGVILSYNGLQAFAPQSFDMGSNMWYSTDMNGDRLPDLVVTGEKVGTIDLLMSGFDVGSAGYWKLYANTGSGFTSAPDTWNVPAGGVSIDGDAGGFSHMTFWPNNAHDIGSETWSSLDMDGSGTPDLVVTSARVGPAWHYVFGSSGAHYWNVFLNPFAVGTEEHAPRNSGMELFPNPASGPVSVLLDGMPPSSTRVFDASGALLITSRNGLIDASRLSAGCYIVEGTDRDGQRQRSLLAVQ